MKRKEFIATVGLFGVGLGLSPWKMVSARTGYTIFQLPEPSVHIRHGNFHAAAVDELELPELNLGIQKQQFLANGIVPDSKDLMMYSIRRGSDMINVSATGDATKIIGNIPNVKVSTTLIHEAQLSAILVLEGVMQIEKASVNSNEILVLKGTQPELAQLDNCLVLGIYC